MSTIVRLTAEQLDELFKDLKEIGWPLHDLRYKDPYDVMCNTLVLVTTKRCDYEDTFNLQTLCALPVGHKIVVERARRI